MTKIDFISADNGGIQFYGGRNDVAMELNCVGFAKTPEMVNYIISHPYRKVYRSFICIIDNVLNHVQSHSSVCFPKIVGILFIIIVKCFVKLGHA